MSTSCFTRKREALVTGNSYWYPLRLSTQLTEFFLVTHTQPDKKMEDSCNLCSGNRSSTSSKNICIGGGGSGLKRHNRGRLSITVTSALLVIIITSAAVFALDLSPTYDGKLRNSHDDILRYCLKCLYFFCFLFFSMLNA